MTAIVGLEGQKSKLKVNSWLRGLLEKGNELTAVHHLSQLGEALYTMSFVVIR